MNTARVHPIIHLAWLKSTCKFYSMRSKPPSSWLSRCCVTNLCIQVLCHKAQSAVWLLQFPRVRWTGEYYLYTGIVSFSHHVSCKTHELSVAYICTFPSPYNNFKCCSILQFLLSVDLVLCACTKQALFLVMSLWPISQPLDQLQLLQYSNLYYLHTRTKQALFLFPCHVSLTYEVQGCFQMDFLNTSISKCSWLVRSHSVWYCTNGLGMKLLISSSLSKINLFFQKT